uniref:Uncharacterized protein n=1 Tax=Anopheles epiroticus TaxID=199890 RepID=A0A182P2R2_9DIPT
MIANESVRANAPPSAALASASDCTGGVPRESSTSSPSCPSSSEVNTGTVKRRPTSLEEVKEKTPSPTSAYQSGIGISNTKESEQHQDEKQYEKGTNGSGANDSGVLREGSKKSPDRPTVGSADAIKSSSNARKVVSESKIPAAKTARLDERLKSKLKPPGALQRASYLTSSKGDGKEPSRTQKKVSFIPNLSMTAATVTAPGGNIRTSAVKTILRTRAQQQQQSQQDSSVEYKELYRDYPLPLPPYRDPPPAPPPTSTNVGTIEKQCPTEEPPMSKNEDVSTVVRSKLKGFGLGKLISSHTGQERRNTNNYVTLPPSPKSTPKTMSSKGAASVGGDLPAIPQVAPAAASGGQGKPRSPDDILAKPEFSSSLFKNLPVRQKKGTVPHLENYCLFDPSVDFFNEKEHKMRAIPEVVELADQVLYQDHLIYDAVVDRDSDNYFTIEPESLEIEVKNRMSLEKVEEKIDEIFNKTRTASSSSTSSTSGSSPDYPSMFNSVIETPSSNLESTDESDYGFRNRLMENLKVLVPKSISGSIPDENAEVEEIPDEDAEDAGAAAAASVAKDLKESPTSSSVYYGVVLKASPITSRLERVHQQQSVSLPNSPLIQHRLQQQQQAMKQHRKCDESSSSSSSSATASPPIAPSEGAAGATLLRQNTFTCSGSTVTLVGESVTSVLCSTAQTPGTPKAINTTTVPSSTSSTIEQDKLSVQKVTKMKSVASGTNGGKVANFLPLLRSTFALDPLKSSFSLPQLPTGGVVNGGASRVSATGAISKVQSANPPRNGSLDATPLFNRLRKRERPLSNHSDADSGFLSPATPPDSNGASILAACDEVMDQEAAAQAGSGAQSTSDAVVLEQCDSIQELIQMAPITGTCHRNGYGALALGFFSDKRKINSTSGGLSARLTDPASLLPSVIRHVTTVRKWEWDLSHLGGKI